MTDLTHVARAQREFERRKDRCRYLPDVEFTDTPWDIILYLFTQTDGAISTGVVGSNVAAPRTTVLRHLTVLQMAGMIERSTCSTDRRHTLVRLTDKAIRHVAAYLEAEIPTQH